MRDTVRMMFVGDIALGGECASRYGAGSPKWTELFLDLKPLFCEADFRIGNLESPLFLSPTPQCKRNVLGATPESVEALSFLGFTALSLANNHITDQGPEGITRTCEILSACNISHFGAGENLDAALRPAFARVNDLSFAFLGYAAELQDVGAKPATESRAGCAPLSLDRIGQDIAAIRDTVSHIVVSLHWGYQFDHYPEPQQIEMARKIIDLGALIVHGHHPHVVQGMERYRNGLILYSLGNFFLPNFKRTDGCRFRFPKESLRTVVTQCVVGSDGVHSVSLVPLLVGSDYRVRVLHGSAANLTIAKLDRRSAALHTANYCEHWSIHHKKTMAKRARFEFRLRLCGGISSAWRHVRTRGLWGSIRRLRARQIAESIRKVRRFLRRDQSKIHRKM
ncbi:MAG: CapA family protein [Thermodesulfovibrionales bacterium]|nr:CapA family protein [Thermodesulfovibrionales bacterium]